MKLTFWTRLNSNKTNTRMNISNMPTQFLLKLYYTKSREVLMRERVFPGVYKYVPQHVPLTTKQHRAIHNLLRLRLTKRGSLLAEV